LHCDCIECVAPDPRYAGRRGAARSLIERLARRGVSFRPVDGKVRFRPSGLVTDEERAEIKRVRDEVYDLLREDEDRRRQGAGFVRDLGEVFDLAREVLGVEGDSSPEVGAPATLTLKRAALRGLTAKWSREFGFITLHDPSSGESHDIPTSDAPDWAKWESGERKRRWRAGDRRAFDLSAREIEAIWDKERPPPEEGIVEDHPLPG
jgi:hypothetical protein